MGKNKPNKQSLKQSVNHSNQSNLLKFMSSGKASQQQVNNNKEPNSQSSQQQKYIKTNTSLTHVLAMISMSICRKITNNELIRKRLIIYLCLVLIGGLVNDFAPLLSRSFMFKIQKTNVLNQWVVKIGWFWTTILTFPLMALTSVILSVDKENQNTINTNSAVSTDSKSSNKLIKFKQFLSYLRTRQLLRLLINTCVWFISTNLFVYFEEMTGWCLELGMSDPYPLIAGNESKANCLRNGSKWVPGFDISGHTFLLIYSNLILIEESAVMIGWEPFGNQLFEQMANTRPNIRGDTRGTQAAINEKQHRLYNQYTQVLRILFVFITVLSIIWDFMLVQTSLFYHSMIQKLIAAIWAVGLWALTYRYIYTNIEIDVKAPKLNKNL